VAGGDQVYLQKQNWPLEMLGKDVPQAPAAPPPPVVPAKALDEADLLARVLKDLQVAA
jgi:hypothetical protein